MRSGIILVVLVALTNLAFAQKFQFFVANASNPQQAGWQVSSYYSDNSGALTLELGFGKADRYFQNVPTSLAAFDEEDNIFFGGNGWVHVYRADLNANKPLKPWDISKSAIAYTRYDNKNDYLVAVIAPSYGPEGILLVSAGPGNADQPTINVIRSFSNLPGGANDFGLDVANQIFYWTTDETVNASYSYMHLHWISMSNPTQEQQVKSCGAPWKRSEIFIDPKNSQPFLFIWHPYDKLYGIMRLNKQGTCQRIVNTPPSLIGNTPLITFDSKTRTVYSMWQDPYQNLYVLMGVNIDTAAMTYKQTINIANSAAPISMVVTNN